MAKVTKAKILKETEKIEKEFTDMEDELLLNIARSIEGGDFSAAKQLAKIGKLTEENIEIISKYNKKWEKEIRECLEEIAKYATKDVDQQFKEAEGKGEIKPPEVPDEIYNATIDGFTAQTIDKLKAMNGTILASSLEQYQKAIYEIEQAKQKIAAEWLDREVRYDEMAEAAQNIYIQGQATMRASAEAIRKLNQEGITGFIDRAGRHWNADTYAAMVTRTNAHSLSIESVKARQEEYGSDIFQISSHGGSRELCYPYQGKLYSWTAATGGTFKDGAGVKQQYGSLINDTSYGEPAGIFGINCGHYPMPIIPGVSIVHEQPIQDPEENAKEYAESQKQRYLERQIREAKREYEMLKASGADEQTLKEARDRIGEKQKNMRGFIDETGRTRRYDREKLFFENSGNYKPTMSALKEKPSQQTQTQTQPTITEDEWISVADIVRQQDETETREYNGQRAFAKRFSSGQEANNFFTSHTRIAKGQVFDALNYYTGQGYTRINTFLRDYDISNLTKEDKKEYESTLQDIKSIDKAIAKAKLNKDIVVRRAVPLGTIDYVQDFVSDKTIFTDQAFMSTTVQPREDMEKQKFMQYFEEGVEWMEIVIPAGEGRGLYVNSASNFEDEEYEFLIARNSKFKITGVRVEDGKIIYEMTMIT